MFFGSGSFFLIKRMKSCLNNDNQVKGELKIIEKEVIAKKNLLS